MKSVLEAAKMFAGEVIPTGGHVLDATAGNGHDTTFLASCAGPEGTVTSMDIQQQALDETKERAPDWVTLVRDSHANAGKYLSGAPLDCVMFNLGYLPGGDKSVVTTPEETLQALRTLLPQLKAGGRIVMVVYHGHPGGENERDALMAFASSLPQKQVQALIYQYINQRGAAPFLVVLERLTTAELKLDV
ncbi:tRNA (mnm(5)s(2)U34)-methyltransferase [Alkalicoccus urumqiensis]|uniref:rRNA methyltransferase n=1 Tax=Alkalicoccus urumqiensis TaxID=1548213 RepID=A0A2P6MGF1_ALKUR|nr:class I SAM-dependent methyltransferase [Alkalicoccus urumqiensis]PRO65354.1 rRNA methyltransferase [Alkalicoccus urumqiensis]